jgi:uncharacterized phage-associated protein
MAATYSVDQVADTLIQLARERGIEMTNLKLQKLLYYAQAWCLVFTDGPLFDAEFEAWVHGPVVPRVFRRFRGYRWNPITEPVNPVSDAQLTGYLGEVLNKYGSMSATQLERLTHLEDPWKEARNGCAPDASSTAVISQDSMKRFYRKLAGR